MGYCSKCGEKNEIPKVTPSFGTSLRCHKCHASLISVYESSPGCPNSIEPSEVKAFFGYDGCSLGHPRCPWCQKINYSVVFPERGCQLSWYTNREQENPQANFVVNIECFHCGKSFFVEWDGWPFISWLRCNFCSVIGSVKLQFMAIPENRRSDFESDIGRKAATLPYKRDDQGGLIWVACPNCLDRALANHHQNNVAVEKTVAKSVDSKEINKVDPLISSTTTNAFNKENNNADLHAALLNKIEVYCEAMRHLATCPNFNDLEFERVDNILSKVGANLGPQKRRELLSQSQFSLPAKTKEGGLEELRVMLIGSLASGFKAFNEILYKTSPTSETANEVIRIIKSYEVDPLLTFMKGDKESHDESVENKNSVPLRVTCVHCGESFMIGEDAYIIRDEDKFDSLDQANAKIIVMGEMSRNPDLVSSSSRIRTDEKMKQNELKKVAQIKEAIVKGQHRSWYCGKCRNTNQYSFEASVPVSSSSNVSAPVVMARQSCYNCGTLNKVNKCPECSRFICEACGAPCKKCQKLFCTNHCKYTSNGWLCDKCSSEQEKLF